MQTFILNMLIFKNFPKGKSLEDRRYEDQINLPQLQGTPGSKKKVIVDLSVKQPDSSRIQLGISCSALTMI